jgi:NADH-quinone oxidoreductase subunit N
MLHLNDFFILMKQELVLVVILFVLLFIKVFSSNSNKENILKLVNILLLINIVVGFFFNKEGWLFADMYQTNCLLCFEKNILNVGVWIISLQSYNWLKEHQHVEEFYMLMLSSLLGMFYMISSGNLLMFYLALELSTIPIAAMANFDLDKRRSSEAAMKLIFSSAFSSGLLLLGISFIYGTTGTLNFIELSSALSGSPLQIFSFVLLFAGFGFKISAVPFHLWTADVYEGSPVAVTSYLSVISKGAIVFVFVSVLFSVFKSFDVLWYNMIFIVSIMTMLIGNLFAIRQQNMKRFLAFSSIAQVGFILIGMSSYTIEGSTSVVFFILIYVFSNLAAFGVISLISALTGKENVDDYKGLYKTNPALTWVLTIALFSLAGIPPTAGFFGKFFLLIAGAGKGNYFLIAIAAVNMVIALYYYLRVVKAMFMDENETPIEHISISFFPKISFVICIIGIVVTGLYSNIYQYIYQLFMF